MDACLRIIEIETADFTVRELPEKTTRVEICRSLPMGSSNAIGWLIIPENTCCRAVRDVRGLTRREHTLTRDQWTADPIRQTERSRVRRSESYGPILERAPRR